MGILGLTHDDSGSALQKLPVGIKVAIGEPPDANNPKGHPKRLDHFVFKRREQRGQEVGWEAAQDIAKVYGENPREIGIILMDDDVENVLRTQLAWWSQTELKCGGELVQIDDRWAMQAIRKTERCPDGEVWPGSHKYSEGAKKGQPVEPCGDGCPDLEARRCKPNGALYFNLDKFPMVGAIASIRTTSYRSIRNLSNALMQIRNLTGGRLAGIRVMLRAEPEKSAYDGLDGKKHTSIAHILSLRIDATDMKVLLDNMTETAKLFQQTKMLGAGSTPVQYIVDDPEKDRAHEMTAEFYPATEDEERTTSEDRPTPQPAKDAVDPTLNNSIHDLCMQLGMNRATYQSLVGQWRGKLPELETKLKADIKAKNSPANHPPKTEAAAAKPAKTSVPPPQPTSGQSNAEPYLDF